MITFLLSVIIVVLILLIINQFVNNYADSHTVDKLKDYTIEDSIEGAENLRIKKIGICYSMTRLFPYEIYTLAHEDLLCKCDDGKWYILAEIYDKGDTTGESGRNIGIREVSPIKKQFGLAFVFNGYRYKCLKLHKPDCYVNLKFAYDTFRDEFNMPYHVLRNNCHHMSHRVLNIITGQLKKRKITEFEPLKYLKNAIGEVFNNNYDEENTVS